MTFQIIYSSVSSMPMQREALEDILEQAQINNAHSGISGALVYVDGFFLQVLEGEREALQQLMQTISRDLRHESISVLQAGEVPAAAFSTWKMAYVSATPEQVAQWVGLSVSTTIADVWDGVQQDRAKVEQLTKGILSVLVPDASSPAAAG